MDETLQIRIHGTASKPTLVYLPGLHGDWTLVGSFRRALGDRVRFVEFTFPRTLTWSLEDYAAAIERSLLDHGIMRGWLLGESFGSQIAWPLAKRCAGAKAGNQTGFVVDGVILTGGFVRHPMIWAVWLAGAAGRGVSLTWLTRLLFGYAKLARFRHRHAPEVLAGIQEFIARRTELDRQAAVHRLRLIAASDPRPTARQLQLPVHDLTGAFDPIVPWPGVRWWLRRHCPGYRGGKTIWHGDHNILGTAPRASADAVAAWVQRRNSKIGVTQFPPKL